MARTVTVENVQPGKRYGIFDKDGEDVITIRVPGDAIPCYCPGTDVHVWVEGEESPRHFPAGYELEEL